MSDDRSGSAIQRMLGKVEDRVEEWRARDTERKVQAERDRNQNWEEAVERERLLAEQMKEEEAREDSPIGTSGQKQRVAYVVHSKDMGQMLREFADGRQRLVETVPGRGDHPGEAELEGSWLVFEEE
ncbi:MAG: hypothetical protein ACFB50_18095 [Rubrobacteraceae bacterium]